MPNILFIDSVHPILEERLIQMGFVCEHDYTSSKTSIKERISDYVGIIIRSRFTIDKTFLDNAEKPKIYSSLRCRVRKY